MSDHPTHKIDGYLDDRVWTAFCKVCSAEGEFLAEVCPGRFVPNRERKIDTAKEHK